MKKLLFVFIGILFFSMNATSQGCADAGDGDGVKIIGFIQPQYEYQFLGDSVQSIMNGLKTPSSFYFNRARLGVTGNIPYDFSYYFIAEYSPTKGGAAILDAFVTYNRWAPYLKISMGQFKMPFGLELSTPCQDLYSVDRSRVVNELASPFREFGVMMLGSTGEKEILWMKHKDVFKYFIALTNGSGLNVMDNNTDKDIMARLIFQPIEGLEIGGSFKYGRQAAISANMIDDSRLRFGGDLSFKKYNVILQGEYIYGKDKGSSLVGGGCGSTPTIMLGNFIKSGYWAALQYETKWKLNPLVKYQSFLATTDIKGVDDQTQTELIFGLNYYFNDYTRFQANFVITDDSAIHDGKDFTKNFLVLQMQVKFN